MPSALPRLLASTALVGMAFLPWGSAVANPVGGSVSSGSASITSNGNALTVNQASNKAVINWQGFNIAPGEITQFQQPSSSSIALNRINDTNPSEIDGQLTANGNIILINPNGVVFGKGSTVDVNGLVATTANISDSDFMNNAKPVFNQPGNANGQVINNGTITVGQAGLAGLVAPHVENNGTISATLGKVALASGDTFTLDMAGDGITNVAISSTLAQQVVSNSGTIDAPGGKVMLTAAQARGAVDSLVSNAGIIQADTFQQVGGQIVLSAPGGTVTNTGTIEARGLNASDNGGQVSISAANVQQQGKLDVSGQNNGGSVAIAFTGSYIDSPASVMNASGNTGNGGSVSITGTGSSAATITGLINASAQRGQGGTITLSAGDYVTIQGATINASGYTAGGTVNLSAGNQVQQAGMIDVSSTGGDGGTVTISAATVQQQGTIDASGENNGGTLAITFTQSYSDSPDAVINAEGNNGAGGSISITSDSAGSSLNASGLMTAESELSSGGDIVLYASDEVALRGARAKARGRTNGGSIRIGSDALGNRKATDVSIDSNSVLMADSTGNGAGGAITIAANDTVTMQGQASATGSSGGTIEVSFGNSYADSASALLDVSATNGNAGLPPGASAQGGTIHIEGDDNATLTASGDYIAAGDQGTGGEIDMLAGENVFLLGALLNAQGSAGGGTIRVGGDFHGQGTTRRSQYTYVDANTTMFASATDNGDGGNIVVWSDTETTFAGTISAMGAGTGSGGYVETSGHTLSVTGSVNASSPNGQSGTWLLDPANIVIDQSSCSGTNCLSANTIGTTLSGGTSVTISTTGTGSITIDTGGVTITSTNNTADVTLTLEASTDIVMSASSAIIGNGSHKLNVVFDADTGGSGGTIQMNSGANLTTGGGNITFGGGSLSGGLPTGAATGDGSSSVGCTTYNGICVDGATLNAQGGNITMNGDGYNITSGPDSGYGGDGIFIYGNSAVETTGSGAISLTGSGLTGNSTAAGVQIGYTGDTANVISVQNGNLTIIGTGGSATGANNTYGVWVDAGTTVETTGTGNISISGTGGGGGASSSNNYGVFISNGGIVESTYATGNTSQGTITIIGTGSTSPTGANSTCNTGVLIGNDCAFNNGPNGSVTSVDGNISITGTGGSGAGSANEGVAIFPLINGGSGTGTGLVETTGLGSISITGTGGNTNEGAGGYQEGIEIEQGAAVEATGSGSVSLKGTGGSGTGGNNYGISIDAGGNTSDTETVTAKTGAINITAIAGSGGSNDYGFITDVSTVNIGTTSNPVTSGNITLETSSISLGTATNFNTTGALDIYPYNSGTAMYVGGTTTNSTSILDLTSTFMGFLPLSTASSITFGDTTNTAAVTINYTTSFAAPVTFTTNGAAITLNSNLTSSGTAFNFNDPVTLGQNETITTSGGAVNFNSTVNSTSGQHYNLTVANSGGNVLFTGAVGGTTSLGTLSVSGSGTATIDGNVTTTSTQTYSGPVTLGGNATFTTTNSGVTFTGAVNATSAGAQNMTVSDGTGTTTFSSTIGATTALGNLTLTDDAVSFGGNIFGTGTLTLKPSTSSVNMNVNDGTSSGLYLTSTEQGYIQSDWAGLVFGKISLTGNLTAGASTWSSNVSFITGSGLITLSGVNALGSHNLTIQTNVTPTVSATPTGTGTLWIEPSTNSTTLGVAGGAGTINVGTSLLTSLGTSWGTYQFGNTSETGNMTVGAHTWGGNLVLMSNSGVVSIGGAQTMTANNFTLETNVTPTFSAAVTTTGNITVETSGSTTLGIGTNASGTVNISDTVLTSDLSAGSYIFGSNSTGNLDINTAATDITAHNLTFISGGTIYLDKSGDTSPQVLSKTDATTTTLTLEAGTDIVTAGAITASGSGALNVVFDSDTGGSYGSIVVTGNITTNNGYLNFGGGSLSGGLPTGAATGDGNDSNSWGTGIYVGNATLSTGSGGITMTGTADSNSGGAGIYLLGTSVTTTSGNITFTGISGGGSGSGCGWQGCYSSSTGLGGSVAEGVYVSASSVTTASGAILFTGSNQPNDDTNAAIMIDDNRGTGSSLVAATGNGTITLNGTETGAGYYSQGVFVEGNSTISVHNGNLSITGNEEATGTGYQNEYGVAMDGGTVETTGTGNISITGTGSPNGFANYGVYITGGGSIKSTDATGNTSQGAITITGTGGGANTSGTDWNDGVYIGNDGTWGATGGGSVTSVDGSISITGTGGAGAGVGIRMNTSSSVSASGLGAVTLNGTGIGTEWYGGVTIISSTVSVASGNLSITGVSTGPDDNQGILYGVEVNGSTVETTGTGNISIAGTGGADTGGVDLGVYLASGAVVESTDATGNTSQGAITITGTAGGGGWRWNYGVDIGQASVTTKDGSISITGTGGSGSSGSNAGITLGFDAPQNTSGVSTVSASGLGSITLNGTGGVGAGGYNTGVGIGTSGTTVSVASGNISITGLGGGNSSDTTGNDYGVTIANSGNISATGSGNITISGTGGDAGGSGNDSYGFALTGNSTVASTSGATSITGVGGSGSGGSNYGFYADATATNTLGSASANGNITLIADTISLTSSDFAIKTSGVVTFAPHTASTTVGVNNSGSTLNIKNGILNDVSSNAALVVVGSTADTGALTDTAHTWGNNAELITGNGTITVSGNQTMGAHNFTIETNTTPTFSANITTTGLITVETAGNSLGVGTNATGTVNISDSVLTNNLTAGSYQFGSTITGAVDINTAATDITAKNLSFISGGTIYLDKSGDTSPQALSKIDATNTTLTMQAGTDIVTSGNITASGSGQLNILMDSDYAGSGGAISISGNITSNGGNIILGGGNNTITAGSGYAVGDSGNADGVNINGATVNAGSGNIIINGQGYAGSAGSQYGVEINNSTVEATGNGTVTIYGTGGGNSSDSTGSDIGVNIHGGGMVSVVNGNLTVHGTGGDASGSGWGNYGVDLDNSGAGISTVETTGTGNITLTGIGVGSSGSAVNTGIIIADSGGNGGLVESTGATGNTSLGTITLNGTGGSGSSTFAMQLSNGYGDITSVDGNITLNGNGGGTSISATSASPAISSSGKANIILTDNDFIGLGGIIRKLCGYCQVFCSRQWIILALRSLRNPRCNLTLAFQ